MLNENIPVHQNVPGVLHLYRRFFKKNWVQLDRPVNSWLVDLLTNVNSHENVRQGILLNIEQKPESPVGIDGKRWVTTFQDVRSNKDASEGRDEDSIGEFHNQGCGGTPKTATFKIHFYHHISTQLPPLGSKINITTPI